MSKLSVKNKQLQISNKEEDDLYISFEDLGVIVLDNPAISISKSVMIYSINNNISFIVCNEKHLPAGILLPLEGNVIQNEKYREQIAATQAINNNLWKQIVISKIRNQAKCLNLLGKSSIKLIELSKKVLTGDKDNIEARAAKYYWRNLFNGVIDFRRHSDGDEPNNLLNYGYAILRSIVARAIVISGLLPTIGIHHHNRYNSFALADDLMEPYRPFVDLIVYNIVKNGEDYFEINSSIKRQLLAINMFKVVIGNRTRQIMDAVIETTSSLSSCYNGEKRKLVLPVFNDVV